LLGLGLERGQAVAERAAIRARLLSVSLAENLSELIKNTRRDLRTVCRSGRPLSVRRGAVGKGPDTWHLAGGLPDHEETDERSRKAKIAMWDRLRPRVHHELCWFPSTTSRGQQHLWGRDVR
jgi:hypothetical protein